MGTMNKMAAPMAGCRKLFDLSRSFTGLAVRRSLTNNAHLHHGLNLPLVAENKLLLFTRSHKCIRAAAGLHTSPVCKDLNEFFDKKDNWAEPAVRVGRPYRMDELRLKSNSDLHKLWYVLLKERNMLMTMATEYKRQNELFPNPERLEKVEDSMENILDVVRERDTALSLLETGEIPEPCRKRWAYNELGIGYWRKYQEYHVPIHMNQRFNLSRAKSGRWQLSYMRLYREMKLRKRREAINKELCRVKRLKRVFPNADIEPDLREFEQTMASTAMRGPRLDESEVELEKKAKN